MRVGVRVCVSVSWEWERWHFGCVSSTAEEMKQGVSASQHREMWVVLLLLTLAALYRARSVGTPSPSYLHSHEC